MPFFAPGPCLLFALPPPEPCRNQHLHLSLSTAHKPERSLPRAGRSGGGFQLPVAPSVAGRYSDPNHPEGYRAIAVRGDGSATVVGSDRAKSGVEWTLPAEVSGETITIDFTAKAPQVGKLAGAFDGCSIRFPDGNRWAKE